MESKEYIEKMIKVKMDRPLVGDSSKTQVNISS